MKISLGEDLKKGLAGFKVVRYKKDETAAKETKKPSDKYKSLALNALLYQKHGEKALGAFSKHLEADIEGKKATPDLLDKDINVIRKIAKTSKTTGAVLARAKAEAEKLKPV